MNKVLLFVCFLLSNHVGAYPLQDIYKNLDITSFKNSIHPKMVNKKNTFPHFSQIPKPIFEEDSIILKDEYWIYIIKVVKEDNNGIHLCFTDHALLGSYDAQEPLLVRKYGERYIALSMGSDVCEEYAR